MRRGFTMIELIFVIVILGILAAVALPKFVGVTAEARKGKITAFAGTLNRTVLPSLWSRSMSSGNNGVISGMSVSLSDYTDVPDIVNITNFPGGCDNNGSGTIGTADYGDGTVTFYCFEGNATTAPWVTFVSGSDKNLTIN